MQDQMVPPMELSKDKHVPCAYYVVGNEDSNSISAYKLHMHVASLELFLSKEYLGVEITTEKEEKDQALSG